MQETYSINPKMIDNLYRFVALVEEYQLPYELEYCDNYTFSTIIGSNLEYDYKDSVSDEVNNRLSLKIYF
ncbi:hypothetical protein C4R89_07315 [Clostridioides difficile]|nr:hypothetical protein [Clostridioides difficile]MDB0439351.1 hypothetical protein [Clostridioides difficile]